MIWRSSTFTDFHNSRGKKIFRKFQDTDEERASSAATDLSDAPSQRRLKRQAGVAAQRPLTRSGIKPRLLFPSEEQLAEREADSDDIDEEALTDIEMPIASSSEKHNANAADLQTPAKQRFLLDTPPPTSRTTRSMDKQPTAAPETPVVSEEANSTSFSIENSLSGLPKRKTKSPFESWPRTKAGRKREGDATEKHPGSAKRTKVAVGGSPV